MYKDKQINYKNKNVLVIGGTSGLGKSLAKILFDLNANVTVASRSANKTQTKYNVLVLDVSDIKSFPAQTTNFDVIFCCAGIAKPGYFANLQTSDYQNQMNTNFIGTVNSLHHFYKHNVKPFKFVMVASTVALYTFPGYSAYSASKAALKSFYDSVFYEMKRLDIDLYIYYVTTMQTEGLIIENKIKPKFVTDIEGKGGICPDTAAKILLTEMLICNEIYSDSLTYLFNLKGNIKCFTDILLLPIVSIIFVFIKKYVKYRFSKSKMK
ncbi:3-dehydrosphinganine reductase [Binucleata daphniae]